MAKYSYNAAATGIAAVGALANSGLLRIYESGSTPPTNADDAAVGTLLAELTMNSTAFGSASDSDPGATISANAIASDSSADATGTADYCRIYESDGTTVVSQGTVTASGGGGDLELTSIDIVETEPVGVSSLTFTQPES